jgi:hypothetical protein
MVEVIKQIAFISRFLKWRVRWPDRQCAASDVDKLSNVKSQSTITFAVNDKEAEI